MSSETDAQAGDGGRTEGYVHVPEGTESVGAAETDRDLGRRGWLLVGVVVLATLVFPGVVYLYPTVLSAYLPFRVAMLAVPFLPAVMLGLVAVWAMATRAG